MLSGGRSPVPEYTTLQGAGTVGSPAPVPDPAIKADVGLAVCRTGHKPWQGLFCCFFCSREPSALSGERSWSVQGNSQGAALELSLPALVFISVCLSNQRATPFVPNPFLDEASPSSVTGILRCISFLMQGAWSQAPSQLITLALWTGSCPWRGWLPEPPGLQTEGTLKCAPLSASTGVPVLAAWAFWTGPGPPFLRS